MGIEFVEVYAGYRRGQPILRGVTAKLEPPVVILGPNGAGKTTLFRVILGLTPVHSGRVLLDGVDVDEIYGRPGLVSTNLAEVYGLLHLPMKDLAKLYISLAGGSYERFLEMVREFGVEHVLGKTIEKLSAGERRTVLNAVALAIDSKYALLDEPFENLDPKMRVRMLAYLLKESRRVIINTHATWLLKRLEGWKAYIMVSGRLYGPVEASKLPELGLEEGEKPGAELVIEVDERKVSLVRGGGLRISEIDSLDRLYEVVAG